MNAIGHCGSKDTVSSLAPRGERSEGGEAAGVRANQMKLYFRSTLYLDRHAIISELILAYANLEKPRTSTDPLNKQAIFYL